MTMQIDKQRHLNSEIERPLPNIIINAQHSGYRI